MLYLRFKATEMTQFAKVGFTQYLTGIYFVLDQKRRDILKKKNDIHYTHITQSLIRRYITPFNMVEFCLLTINSSQFIAVNCVTKKNTLGVVVETAREVFSQDVSKMKITSRSKPSWLRNKPYYV